jgi:hexosaminidase
MRNTTLLTLLACFLATVTTDSASATGMKPPEVLAPAIVPQPRQMNVSPGFFRLNRNTVVVYAENDRDLLHSVTAFVQVARRSTGFPLPLRDMAHRPSTNAVVMFLAPGDTLGSEGYRLTVRDQEVLITAQTARGAFYGANTLLQLFPPAIFSERTAKGVTWTAPCVEIVDAPRYPWRGMMLDVVRHFFPKEFVKRYIDYLAMHKMNIFHWHLTDDQGWRIQIMKYPELTDIGAWRVDHENIHWNARPEQRPGERATYGGFYTQQEIREVVQYAADRFITVVPEVEMPAHVTAVISAFPQYSCTGGPFTVLPGGLWPIKDIYCAGNESTFVFIENVLKEVAALFPGPYIHIGGDEANKTEWKRCPKCQARMRDEHLTSEEELQSYFVKRVEKILTGLNRRLIGWDEILEGGLAPQATVMSWRGVQGGIAAARAGHDVIMAPTSNCYLDYYQGDQQWEPLAIGAFIPLSRVYALEPTPDSLTGEEGRHILGTQGNLWTEFIPDRAQAEYMIFPRIAAMAEVAWTARGLRAWPGFLSRMDRQLLRYNARGIHAALSIFSVAIRESIDVTALQGIVTLETQAGTENIRYTLDGKQPRANSRKYSNPFALKQSATVSAASFDGTRQLGPTTTRRVWVPRHTIVGITCETPLDSLYARRGTASLTNNRRGDLARNDASEWRGVSGKDLCITVDLGKTVPVSRVTIGFLHQTGTAAFLPARVDLAVSNDGNEFRNAGHVTGQSLQREPRPFVKDYSVSPKNATGRFLRITAKNPGPVPDWHKAAGAPTVLLTDEIIIE